MKIDLINPGLFGNDAGEDEDPDILSSYFLEKAEHTRFFSKDASLAFVRSRKGVGKSAMLKEALSRRERADEGEILLYVKASDLVALQEISGTSPGQLVHGWQQRICSRINLEIGSLLRIGFSDDSMTLIEQAELSGFRGRNLVGSLIDRMRIKVKNFEISRERVSQGDSKSILSRIMDGQVRAWIFIDDVDATFLNTHEERLRVSSFFSACRNICSTVKGLTIRASVRTDVWTLISQYDEALDKCEQYMVDIHWSTAETATILKNKIKSYFDRTYSPEKTIELLRSVRSITNLVFKEPFPWGASAYEAVRPIHILSGGRPRWASQLCRLAGKEAHRNDRDLIAFQHIEKNLRQYGQSRLGDLYKEHRHQCPKIEILIEAFAGGGARYSTKDLLSRIGAHVVKKSGLPEIDGIRISDGVLAIAHFLYRIGFLAARDQTENALGFVNFEDRPNLLTTVVNLDDEMNWEIHPSYRNVLRIKRKDSDI